MWRREADVCSFEKMSQESKSDLVVVGVIIRWWENFRYFLLIAMTEII
jgi:hypothetical protein